MTRRNGSAVVAIVGGGFTGAAVAYHLAKTHRASAARIVVVEPRAMLGAGLAYSTPEPSHRINVPAARMSLESGDPEQFDRWLRSSGLPANDPAAFDARGVFPQRRIFGEYVASMLKPCQATGRIVHVRDRAAAAAREPDGSFRITLESGAPIAADVLVLATTHPLPAVPAALRTVAASQFFVADPYDADRLSRIDPDASILVVGNGLTAADIVAALDRRGHRGRIGMLSRNGLRSRGHAPLPVEPFGDFASDPSPTTLALLRKVRRTIERAANEGMSWHAVMDAVRNQGTSIWQALPENERRTLVRRLRVFWDVHRFRVAPQVERVLDRMSAAGRLRTIAATLLSAAEGPTGGIEIAFRRRYAPRIETETFDIVVNTTGPAHRGVVQAEPAGGLQDAGLIRLDAVGLGLATARDGRAVDASGLPVPGLYIAGPLARGTFGELMGLLDVTRYAEFIAAEVAAEVSRLAGGKNEGHGELGQAV